MRAEEEEIAAIAHRPTCSIDGDKSAPSSASAERRRRGAHTDEARGAGAVQPLEHIRPANPRPEAVGGEREEERVERCEADERRLHDRELRQERRLMVDELGHEGDKEGDRFRIERGDDEGVEKMPRASPSPATSPTVGSAGFARQSFMPR